MSPPTPESIHHAVVLGPPGGHWPDAGWFGAWCAANPGARCTLWLSGTLTRPLLADAAARFPDATALAGWARRVVADYEDVAEATPAEVATWRSGDRSGACVLDVGFDLAACRASAAEHRVRIAGIHPLWAGALALLERDGEGRSALHADGSLLVVDGVQTTVLRWRDGALIDLRQRWLVRAEAAEIDALVTELLSDPQSDGPVKGGAVAGKAAPLFILGHGVAGWPQAPLRVLGSLDQGASELRGCLPRQLVAPDFARPPIKSMRPWAQRALAATAVAVLAVAVHDAWSARGAHVRSLDASEEALIARPARGAVAAPTRDAALIAGDPQATAREAGVRLQHPWPQLFAAIEATALDGEWLVLDHRAQQATFRLGGIASSTAQAMATARALSAADGVVDALVSRAEPTATGQLAFDITGRLQKPRLDAGVQR